MGKIPHRPTIGGPTQKLGVGAGSVIAAGNRLLRRRPWIFLDWRGGEYEAADANLLHCRRIVELNAYTIDTDRQF